MRKLVNIDTIYICDGDVWSRKDAERVIENGRYEKDDFIKIEAFSEDLTLNTIPTETSGGELSYMGFTGSFEWEMGLVMATDEDIKELSDRKEQLDLIQAKYLKKVSELMNTSGQD